MDICNSLHYTEVHIILLLQLRIYGNHDVYLIAYGMTRSTLVILDRPIALKIEPGSH